MFSFGAAHGQFVATSSPQPLINGLTLSHQVTVSNAKNSVGLAYIHQQYGSKTTGYVLEPGYSVLVDTCDSNSAWYVSTDGATARVSWIATRQGY